MLLAPDVLSKVGGVREPRAADVTCHGHHAGRIGRIQEGGGRSDDVLRDASTDGCCRYCAAQAGIASAREGA
eukprot:1962865-Lingulodinium_polyedra.AAC.1